MYDSFHISWRTRERVAKTGRTLVLFIAVVIGSGLVSAFLQKNWTTKPIHPTVYRWESMLQRLTADRRVRLMRLALPAESVKFYYGSRSPLAVQRNRSFKVVAVPYQFVEQLKADGIPYLEPKRLPDSLIPGLAATKNRYRKYYVFVPDISRK